MLLGGIGRMKKSLVLLSIVLIALFLIGCINYKTYDAKDSEEQDLINQIAKVEEEISLDSKEETTKVEEEVILPDLEESTSEEEIKVIEANENQLVKLKVGASDPDQDKLTYTFSSPLNNKGEWQTAYGDAGEYLVKLTVSDGQLTTERTVRLIIKKVNVAPVIEKPKDIRVKEGETVSFEPKVSDPNGDAVSVDISPPLNGGRFVADQTSAGEYQITITASDGELTTEQTFNLFIEDVNIPPTISNIQNSIVVKEGETVIIKPEVNDPDGDQVKLSISNPVGDDGIWETSYTDNGEYAITITANDGKQTVTETVTIIVENVNKAPEINDITLETS